MPHLYINPPGDKKQIQCFDVKTYFTTYSQMWYVVRRGLFVVTINYRLKHARLL